MSQGPTRAKLEDTRTSLNSLKNSKNALEYRNNFNAFIKNVREITFAMQKEFSKESWFSDWYKNKQEEMGADDLLRFAKDVRNVVIHEGENVLNFTSSTRATNLNPALVMSKSPNSFQGDGTWEFTFSAEGLSTTINKGTSKEQREMLDQGLVDHKKVSIQNPPISHLGKPINSADPILICSLLLGFFEELLFEASNAASDY